MTRSLLALVGSAGFLALAATGQVSCSGAEESAEIPTYRVQTASFRREVPADGTLEATQASPIAAPQGARMALKIAWMVEDGQRVAEGQVVVRFDPTEMSDRLADGLDRTAQARNRIGKERATSASSQRKRDREAAMAEAEMKAAQEFSYDDDTGIFSRNEVIESQIDRDLASAKMDHARAAKGIERSVSSGKLDVLRVQERQAKLEVSQSREALGMLEVTAPHAGIFLAQRDRRGRSMSVGDTTWPGQKIAEIPRDESMEAKVFVLEADGGALEAGMKATLIIESRPDREYAAEIARIETLAQPRFPDVPVQYFVVTLSLAETERAIMKIGQRVRATILVAESEAIAVPRQAVFQDGGKSYVYRRSAAGSARGFEKVQVDLGASTAGRVAVASGLEAGDEIALARPPSDDGASDGEGAEGNKTHAAR